jgi:hypothetical protein
MMIADSLFGVSPRAAFASFPFHAIESEQPEVYRASIQPKELLVVSIAFLLEARP